MVYVVTLEVRTMLGFLPWQHGVQVPSGTGSYQAARRSGCRPPRPYTRPDDRHGAGRARDEARGQRVSAQRCNELRLTGSGGANRVMEAELKRLVMRSPFGVRVEKPKREGEATLLYPFEACIAWVAGCYHRTSSRISWDLCSSTAVRLEPLFHDLLPALSSDDRLPGGASLRFSVEVGPSFDFEASPLQLRGVVKNAIVETLASRRVASDVDADSPDVVFVVRRAGTPGERRTGNRHRHRWRGAASPWRARGRRACATARDDGGAADHVVALGRAH